MAPAARVGGVGGLGLLLVLGIAFLAGVNPLELIGMLDGGAIEAPGSQPPAAPGQGPDGNAGGRSADPQADFVSVILADTEDTWAAIFADSGRRYEPPRLVLFTEATRSACGMGQAAMGPFYCPADRRIYICLAGVWGYHADRQRQLLEAGDVDEGLRAAAAIGDDVMQRRSQGRVVPESWTHGSAAQRVEWFKRGLSAGRVDQCDTFRAARR